MAWHYFHSGAGKSEGRVSESEHRPVVEEVEDFVNGLGPSLDGIQCIMSEGATSRDFHCFVRDDRSSDRYDLSWEAWRGESSVDTLRHLLEGEYVALVGFDASRTQSVFYFRRLD